MTRIRLWICAIPGIAVAAQGDVAGMGMNYEGTCCTWRLWYSALKNI